MKEVYVVSIESNDSSWVLGRFNDIGEAYDTYHHYLDCLPLEVVIKTFFVNNDK